MSVGRICVSVMTSRSTNREDTMSAIVGPLFLKDQQLITAKETGLRFMKISQHNKTKTEMPLDLVVEGKFFT